MCILMILILPINVLSNVFFNKNTSYIQTFNDYKNNKYGFHDAIDVVMDYAKQNDKVAGFMYNM